MNPRLLRAILDGGGAISGSYATAPTSTNLTTNGTEDWVHWGKTDITSYNHKANVQSKLSALTVLAGTLQRFSPVSWDFSWTDGTPDATGTTIQTGLYIQNLNGGYRFTAAADIVRRRLILYVKAYNSTLQIRASVSDASFPDLVDATLNDTANNTPMSAFTIDYNAARNGQTLTIDVTNIHENAAPGSNDIGLNAATLILL